LPVKSKATQPRLRHGLHGSKRVLVETVADFKELAAAADGFSENFSSSGPE